MSIAEKVSVLSVTVPKAVELTGISRDILSLAQKRGELIYRYPSASPVIRIADLDAYLASLPTQRK